MSWACLWRRSRGCWRERAIPCSKAGGRRERGEDASPAQTVCGLRQAALPGIYAVLLAPLRGHRPRALAEGELRDSRKAGGGGGRRGGELNGVFVLQLFALARRVPDTALDLSTSR